jgi:anti-sigma regulatory factor (Ser/Thr protein kinase)
MPIAAADDADRFVSADPDGPPRVHALLLHRGPDAPALARSSLRDLSRTVSSPELIENAALVVTELVTNAVRYSQGDVELHLKVGTHALLIVVRDEDPSLPEVSGREAAAWFEESGRGLTIVAALAYACGCEEEPRGGKRMWALLTSHGR